MTLLAEQMVRERHQELLAQAARERFIARARRSTRVARARAGVRRLWLRPWEHRRFRHAMAAIAHRRTQCLERLQQVPLFSGLARRQLELLAKRADQIVVAEGTVLALEDRPVPQFMVITRGVAEATVGGNRVAILGPGDHFGELTLLEGEPQVPTVTALTDIEGYVLARREFWGVMQAIPSLSLRLTARVADDLRRANQQLALQTAEAS